MIPQPDHLDRDRFAEIAYWSHRLLKERHLGVVNRPMDSNTQDNIRQYWLSILTPQEGWNEFTEKEPA